MDILEVWKQNFVKMEEGNQKALEAGQLVGRIVKENIADGYAYYRVIKENKKTVRLQSVKGIGDDYQVPYWGDEATVEKKYVVSTLGYADRLNELFAKRRKEKG